MSSCAEHLQVNAILVALDSKPIRVTSQDEATVNVLCNHPAEESGGLLGEHPVRGVTWAK